MTDPQTTLAAILPGWFYPVFLLAIVFGSITNNVLTVYSSGLCLQAVGIPLSRSITVLFDGVLGVAARPLRPVRLGLHGHPEQRPGAVGDPAGPEPRDLCRGHRPAAQPLRR